MDRQRYALLYYGQQIHKKGFPKIRIGRKFVCLGRLGKAYACKYDRNHGKEFVGSR
jgi:hypothetical protein